MHAITPSSLVGTHVPFSTESEQNLASTILAAVPNENVGHN